MFIECIDQLRCINAGHEDIWLVASFHEQVSRFIISGTLGCPLCMREYPISYGAAYFGVDPATQAPLPDAGPAAPDHEAVVRLAAFLNAGERATMVLGGAWAQLSHGLAELLPLRVFALNPVVSVRDTATVAILHTAAGVPLAPMSADGIALDAQTATPDMLASLPRVLKPGGRVVAPIATPVPVGVTELARDEEVWVGEMQRPLVSLRRG